MLKAGADPTIKDNDGLTPLHVCAEFADKKVLWTTIDMETTARRSIDTAGVMISDTLRPKSTQDSSTGGGAARVRDIIRLLIAHGADIAALSKTLSYPIDMAFKKGCEEMVSELSSLMENFYAKACQEGQYGLLRGRSFHTRYLMLRSKTVFNCLKDSIVEGENHRRLCEELLKLGEYGAIEKLPQLGVSFSAVPGMKFLSILALQGYASLFETLGGTIQESSWIDGMESPDGDGSMVIEPYVLTASRGINSNLDVIKVIVEKFNANVNIQERTKLFRPDRSYSYVPGASALHILARGEHWWQTEAIRYLLQHGAQTELRNEKGETALHIAVGCISSAYCQRETTELLLKHGANPNAIDKKGRSCLNKAIHDVELVRLLLNHGADIALGNEPVLLSAITAQDVATITALLKAGADPNTGNNIPGGRDSFSRITTLEHTIYPIYHAATSKSDNPETKAAAIRIIRLLLEHGANPYLNFREDTTILHDIFQNGGIVELFLDLPDLNLGCRDPLGRTLILAACQSNSPARAVILYEKGADLMAVDNDGNNALHLLLSTYHYVNHKDEYRTTLSLLIEKAPALVHQKNAKGYKPFHYAIQGRRK